MSSTKSHNVGTASNAAIHHLNQNLKPEWLRVPEAVRCFGLSRSAIYELIVTGAIKSAAIRKRGAVRGIRLISFDSLAAYIENAANVGNGGGSTDNAHPQPRRSQMERGAK